MTKLDLFDFMFAIAVEGAPMEMIRIVVAPIEFQGVSVMAYKKLATLVCYWQAHDKRTELFFRTKSVNMGVKHSRRARIDLGGGCQLPNIRLSHLRSTQTRRIINVR